MKQKIAKNKRMIISGIIAAAVVVSAVVFVESRFGHKSEVMTYGADSKTAFRTYSNGMIQYTGDGASYVTNSGEKQWSDNYQMITPLSVTNESYTAVYELDGRMIKVYNDAGLEYSVQTSDAILGVSVSKNGYISVITGGNSYMVSVYGETGNLLFQRVEGSNGVYPVCSSVSPGGDVVAIGYIDTTGINIKTKTGLFYVDETKGAEHTDSMFSAMEKNNEVILSMNFLNNKLTVITDRNIYILSKSGMEENIYEVTNEITGIGLCGKKLAIAYGDELPDKEGLPCGTVSFLSSDGRIKNGSSIGEEADYFSSSEGGVVLGVGSKYYGIDKNGEICWTLNTSGNVTGIYPGKNVNDCVYATRTWAVMADMTNFDTFEYDPSMKKKIEEETDMPDKLDKPEKPEKPDKSDKIDKADKNTDSKTDADKNIDKNTDADKPEISGNKADAEKTDSVNTDAANTDKPDTSAETDKDQNKQNTADSEASDTSDTANN